MSERAGNYEAQRAVRSCAPGDYANNNWEAYYRALRQHDPQLWRRSQEAAEGIALRHNLAPKLAAEIEVAVIFAVCDALRLKP